MQTILVLKEKVYGLIENINYGEPERIRTPDLLLRRQLLYPAELLAHN